MRPLKKDTSIGRKRPQRSVCHLILALGAAASLLIVGPAARTMFRSRHGSAIDPTTFAQHGSSASKLSSMAGMSLPERFSAAYDDYIGEMQAAQAQAEADGAWTIPNECKQMIDEIGSRDTFYSEFGQDLFLYEHFFRNSQDKTGRKRFFLDIGANSPEHYSNTLFFEKCLGWEGICVEANPDLAKEFKGRRKCKIENVCISNEASTLKFLKAGFMGHVVADDSSAANGVGGSDTVEIPCMTITRLLAKHNITHVDMLSIDIEGGEYDALLPLLNPASREIQIDVVAMEVFWSDIQLRWLMSDMGFWKVTDIAHVDDIFVRVQPMGHSTASLRDKFYRVMQDSQRERGRPLIAPW